MSTDQASLASLAAAVPSKLAPWAEAERQAALQRFNAVGLPTRQHEEWHYTSLAFLQAGAFERAVVPSDLAALRRDVQAAYIPEAINIVLINGHYSAELSEAKRLPAEVSLQAMHEASHNTASVLQAVAAERSKVAIGAVADLTSALAAGAGFLLVLPAAKRFEIPFHVIHLNLAAEKKDFVAAAHSVVQLGAGARCELWESTLNLGEADTPRQLMRIDIHLAADAELVHAVFPRGAQTALRLSEVSVVQERGSSYSSFALLKGSKLARHSIDAVQQGSEATTRLYGLALAYGQEHAAHKTCMQHRVPRGRSEQFYKSVVGDSARSVFFGKVQVAEGASATEARQLSKNLLLSSDAEVDTEPRLEIDTDEVKCSHGATVSQLRPDEIFYLESRGIPRAKAEHFLAQSFAAEWLYKIENATLRQLLLAAAH